MSFQVSNQSNNDNMKFPLSGVEDRVFQPLIKFAGQDLYQNNVFRILSLPTSSAPQDIRRHLEKVKLMSKYGGKTKAAGPLSMNDTPGPEAMHDLMHDLKEPENRLLQEFFWFWSDPSEMNGKNSALEALKNGDVSAAIKIWSEAPSGEINEQDVGIHNLAVLHHAMALDFEKLAARVTESKDAVKDCETAWSKAFGYWNSVLKSEGVWSTLTNRIRELDDHRLTTGASRRMRSTLPLALLSINAQLAVIAATNGNNEGCARQLSIMRNSWMDKECIDEALRNETKSIMKRLQALRKKATDDAEANYENADICTRSFLEQAQPLLTILDRVIGKGNPTRDNAYDEVALAALSNAISYGNKTSNWAVALELFKLIAPLPVGATACSRVAENYNIIQENVRGSLCWFCEKNKGVEKYSRESKMYGEVKKTPTYEGVRITWNKITVTVPRCATCTEAHSRQGKRISFIGAGMGLVAGSVGIVIWNINTWAGVSLDALNGGLLWGGGGFLGGAFIGLISSDSFSSKGMKSLSSQYGYPRIKELQDQGWAFGEEPPTEE